MKIVFDKLKQSGKEASFLIPNAPNPVHGTVLKSETDHVIIETTVDGNQYRYIAHPDIIICVDAK